MSHGALFFFGEIMNRLLVAGGIALFLVACSKPESAPASPAPTPGAAATVAQVKLELGKDV